MNIKTDEKLTELVRAIFLSGQVRVDLENGSLRRSVSVVLITLMLVGMFTFAIELRPAFAQGGTITINADGSVYPSMAPINTVDNVTYVFAGNVGEGIVVNRSDIVIDGNGFTLTPEPTDSFGFNLTNVDDVTITNANVAGSRVQNVPGFLLVNTNGSQIISNNITGDPFSNCFSYAFSLTSCFNDKVSSNRDNGTTEGIIVQSSGSNVISNNYFSDGIFGGILVRGSNDNILMGNHVSGYAKFGGSDLAYPLGSLELAGSCNNTVIGNDISDNGQGIDLFEGADNNTLMANNCIRNKSPGYAVGEEPPWGFGIFIQSSSNNVIYHNIIAENSYYQYFDGTFLDQNVVSDGSPNIWDDGYPSGGNIWGDYKGTDHYSGPYQNITGSDGIGDTPYVIDSNNVDHYPIMALKNPWITPDIAVNDIFPSKNLLYQSDTLSVKVTVENLGLDEETFLLTIYANETPFASQNVIISGGDTANISLTWNTQNFAYGNYSISAYASPIPGETNLENNNCTEGYVKIMVPGDLNADGRVDLADLVLLAHAYGSKPGDVTWKPNADLAAPYGIIGLTDLVTLAIHYGQHS